MVAPTSSPREPVRAAAAAERRVHPFNASNKQVDAAAVIALLHMVLSHECGGAQNYVGHYHLPSSLLISPALGTVNLHTTQHLCNRAHADAR